MGVQRLSPARAHPSSLGEHGLLSAELLQLLAGRQRAAVRTATTPRFGFTGPADPRLNEFAGSHTNAVQPESGRVRSVAACPQQRRQYPRRLGTSGCITALNGRRRDGSARAGSSAGASTTRGPRKTPAVSKTATAPSGATAPRAWQTQFKANASYPIPKVDIVTSVLLQGYPGPDISANYTATAANVFAQTGVALTGGGSITYDLLPPDTYFLPYQTKVDLRFMKVVHDGDHPHYADSSTSSTCSTRTRRRRSTIPAARPP